MPKLHMAKDTPEKDLSLLHLFFHPLPRLLLLVILGDKIVG